MGRKSPCRDKIEQLCRDEAVMTFHEISDYVYGDYGGRSYIDRTKSLLGRLRNDWRNEIGIEYVQSEAVYRFYVHRTKERRLGKHLPRHLSDWRETYTVGNYYRCSSKRQHRGVCSLVERSRDCVQREGTETTETAMASTANEKAVNSWRSEADILDSDYNSSSKSENRSSCSRS